MIRNHPLQEASIMRPLKSRPRSRTRTRLPRAIKRGNVDGDDDDLFDEREIEIGAPADNKEPTNSAD